MNKTQDDIIAELDFESDGWQSTYLPEQVKMAMCKWAEQECIEFAMFLFNDWRGTGDREFSEKRYNTYLQSKQK